MVPEDDARARLSELTKLLALALQDNPTRALVYNSIQKSCFRERKLDFRRFTDGPGAEVLEKMAAKGDRGMTAARLVQLRDSTPALEFYMPVPDHRNKWKGGDEVIVVTSLHDGEAVIAFDLQGRPVNGLSPEVPPATPALSLVPEETDFDDAANMESSCGGGAAASAALAPSLTTATIPGIYITSVSLKDDGEGWPRGNPEIEAMLMGPITDTMTLAKIDCANESRLGPRYYNQDDNHWTGNVLVADSTQLATIKSKYPPGTPWSKVRFSIDFWEDDSDRCVINTSANNWKLYVLGAMEAVVGGSAWLTGDAPWAFLAGLPLGTLGILQTIGSDDDFLGVSVDKTVWNPMHQSDLVSLSHALLKGQSRNGVAALTWRMSGSPPPPPPPAPFTVTPSAPGYVSTKATYTLSGSANYPATNWKWELNDDGGPTWTTVATTQNTTFTVAAGENVTIQWRLSAKRSSDGVTDIGYASTIVCTVTGGCGGGPIP
jgi:hypothetical protein